VVDGETLSPAAIMPNRPALPQGIGPHEGRELDLMLTGEKPLAMFCDVVGPHTHWPDALFAPHVASGAVVKKDFFHDTPDGRHQVRTVFFALPDDVWRIDAAYALSCQPGDSAGGDDAIALGRLLGYREEDIQAFVAWSGRR
jgi:hypothetical protein